ncbi:hypothetical protein LCGC14_0746180 [marine sediment metagenome]|uniref:Uncharacterized protein n=2 Tax=marine sediment metagenome TaxID=412755 RepID=A0A0F9TCC6_9ZZZZ
MPTPTNGFYRIATYVMAGIVVTGITAWLTFAQDKVTRGELTQARGEDRQYVQELKGTVDRLDVTVRNLSEAVVRLNTILETR